MIIIVDGPEKVGKTTIIRTMKNILGDKVGWVRRWGPVSPDDRAYTPFLQADSASTDHIHIWDRSWASEHVYAKLLDRDRRLRVDPWLGEWLHSRAVWANGMCVMVLPKNAEALAPRRTEDDLPVDPIAETYEFNSYATRFMWVKVFTGSDPDDSYKIAKYLISLMDRFTLEVKRIPPIYCGPVDARVVFVGEKPSTYGSIPGGWLPFTSRLTTELGRSLGDEALMCGWTNASGIDPTLLRSREIVVSCGNYARNWVNWNVLAPAQQFTGRAPLNLHIPHPAWLYRFNNESTKHAQAEVRPILEDIQAHLRAVKGGDRSGIS